MLLQQDEMDTVVSSKRLSRVGEERPSPKTAMFSHAHCGTCMHTFSYKHTHTGTGKKEIFLNFLFSIKTNFTVEDLNAFP